MATVFIPTMLQKLTDGIKLVKLEASSVRQVVEGLEGMFPGMKERLVEDGEIRSNISVAVDGEITPMGILEKIAPDSEVHFVPAIGGGGP
jgi:molybdopterin synthase sulfur carrier subunit